MAVKEYKVLQDAVVMNTAKDKDGNGSKPRRFVRGERVKVDDSFVDVEALVARRAIGDPSDRPVSAREAAIASAQYSQALIQQRYDSGEVELMDDSASSTREIEQGPGQAPTTSSTKPGGSTGKADDAEEEVATAQDQLPNQSDSKADWEGFADAEGLDVDKSLRSDDYKAAVREAFTAKNGS